MSIGDPIRRAEYMRNYMRPVMQAKRAANPDYEHDLRWKLKLETLAAYGGQCKCCGEKRPEFLSVDHKNGNGAAHRREIKIRGGVTFYRWLKQHGFPQEGYQILCMNCNCSIGWFGYCPHQKEREDV